MHQSWAEQHLSGRGALIVAAVVMIALLGALARWTGGAKKIQVGANAEPQSAPLRSMLLGADGRLSTSRTVTAAWTVLIGFAITTLATISIATNKNLAGLGSSLDDNYLLLLGGPFAALVLAKGVTVTRLQNGTLQKSTTPPVLKISDLTSDDAGQTDLIDFQFVVFNLIAMLFVLLKLIQDPTHLPQIPTLLAQLTSLSALTYSGNKAIADNTPKITGVSRDAAHHITVAGAALGGDTASATLTAGGATTPLPPVPNVPQTDTKLVLQGPANIPADAKVTVYVTLAQGGVLQTSASVR